MDENKVMAVRQRQDWTSLCIGLFICGVGLIGVLIGRDLLGWVVGVKIWTSITQSLAPALKSYGWAPGYLSLVCTYVFFFSLMLMGARIVGYDLKKFGRGFSIVFWASMVCLILGNYARIAATPDQYKNFGIGHSLGLTGEFGYVIALFAAFILNLVVNNVRRFSKTAEDLKGAAQNGWYIQIALVIMGVTLGVQTAGAMASALAKEIAVRSFFAAAAVYIIYWVLSYLVSHKLFRFSRETSAVLASALSVCGVAAAQATNVVVKGTEKVLAMICAGVVLYCSLELAGMPFPVGNFLYKDPLVAGSFMAMAVKTDGAAVASGAITQAVIQSKMQSVTGMHYQGDWVLMTTSMVKIWIDVSFSSSSSFFPLFGHTVPTRPRVRRLRSVWCGRYFPNSHWDTRLCFFWRCSCRPIRRRCWLG